MKKVIKKTVKKVVEKNNPEVSNQCPKCLGSGLFQPTFAGSPQCGTCKGEGIIK